jgi:SAM-dependent methyltransferase
MAINISSGLELLARLHKHSILGRRMRVLSDRLKSLLPDQGSVLDVGCGNGIISRQIMTDKPLLSIQGIDVLIRTECAIPVEIYDGFSFPFENKSFDVVMFVDVLHHTADPLQLLIEAKRVARRSIVLKDHLCDNSYALRVLTFMDWVGNRSHGVNLPYNYWSSDEWSRAWKEIGSQPDAYITELGLYPWFARFVFERGLHFVARIPA